MYNGLSQAIVSNQKKESMSIQRVNNENTLLDDWKAEADTV